VSAVQAQNRSINLNMAALQKRWRNQKQPANLFSLMRIRHVYSLPDDAEKVFTVDSVGIIAIHISLM